MEDHQALGSGPSSFRLEYSYLSFLQFLMYFLRLPTLEDVVSSKTQGKQQQLSHLLALNGHHHLFKHVLSELSQPHLKARSKHQDSLSSQYLNATDRDNSTPIVLALKNKRKALVN